MFLQKIIQIAVVNSKINLYIAHTSSLGDHVQRGAEEKQRFGMHVCVRNSFVLSSQNLKHDYKEVN